MVGPEEFLLPAMDKTIMKIRVQKSIKDITLSYEASNMLIAPGKSLLVKLTASAE